MNCDCVNELNQRLEAKNIRITGGSYVLPEFEFRIHIDTEWIAQPKGGKKEKAPPIFASHCPFCGKKVGASSEVSTQAELLNSEAVVSALRSELTAVTAERDQAKRDHAATDALLCAQQDECDRLRGVIQTKRRWSS